MICDKHKIEMKFTRLYGNDYYTNECSVCLDNKFDAEFRNIKKVDIENWLNDLSMVKDQFGYTENVMDQLRNYLDKKGLK